MRASTNVGVNTGCWLEVVLLSVCCRDIEARAQGAETRALQAEEALQTALEKIQDLERKLEGKPSLEAKGEPPPSHHTSHRSTHHTSHIISQHTSHITPEKPPKDPARLYKLGPP